MVCSRVWDSRAAQRGIYKIGRCGDWAYTGGWGCPKILESCDSCCLICYYSFHVIVIQCLYNQDGTILTPHRSFCGVFCFYVWTQGDVKSTDRYFLTLVRVFKKSAICWQVRVSKKISNMKTFAISFLCSPPSGERTRKVQLKSLFRIHIKRRVPKKTIRLWD